jgi:hypothetical protein
MTNYQKLASALVGAVVTVLAIASIDVDPEVVAAVTTLLTAALVWWRPGPNN